MIPPHPPGAEDRRWNIMKILSFVDVSLRSHEQSSDAIVFDKRSSTGPIVKLSLTKKSLVKDHHEKQGPVHRTAELMNWRKRSIPSFGQNWVILKHVLYWTFYITHVCTLSSEAAVEQPYIQSWNVRSDVSNEISYPTHLVTLWATFSKLRPLCGTGRSQRVEFNVMNLNFNFNFN